MEVRLKLGGGCYVDLLQVPACGVRLRVGEGVREGAVLAYCRCHLVR